MSMNGPAHQDGADVGGAVTDPLIEVELEPIWSTIREVRRRMTEKLAEEPREVRNAAAMVASELLENAIKYAEAVPSAAGIRFAFTLSGGEYRIVVSNGAYAGKNLDRLMERIEAIRREEDRSTLYLARLQQLLDEPSEVSGLGIYRIGFEGGFDLQCSYEANTITVTATRTAQCPPP